MAIRKAIYKVDNGSTYDEIMFKTTAEQVFFSDGQTFQDKLNNGTLKGQAGAKGDSGITFIPSVNSSGEISWTNDGSLANPSTVNIKGPKGDKGETGATGDTWKPSVDTDGNLTWTKDSSTVVPSQVNIKGPQGPQGPKGDNGIDATPHVFSVEEPSGHVINRVWIHYSA